MLFKTTRQRTTGENGFIEDFGGKLLMLFIVFTVGGWALMRFVVTYDAATIKQKITKLDKSAVMVSGKVTEVFAFTDIPTTGTPYMGFRFKTRKGDILVATLKDKPTVGATMFMETEVVGSAETLNRRFDILPSRKMAPGSAVAKKILPLLIEKSRIGLPFVF